MGNHKYKVIVSNEGGSWSRPEGDLDLDYTFYAVFILHQYRRTYKNADGTLILDIDN
jgi:hypothetical protein